MDILPDHILQEIFARLDVDDLENAVECLPQFNHLLNPLTTRRRRLEEMYERGVLLTMYMKPDETVSRTGRRLLFRHLIGKECSDDEDDAVLDAYPRFEELLHEFAGWFVEDGFIKAWELDNTVYWTAKFIQNVFLLHLVRKMKPDPLLAGIDR